MIVYSYVNFPEGNRYGVETPSPVARNLKRRSQRTEMSAAHRAFWLPLSQQSDTARDLGGFSPTNRRRVPAGKWEVAPIAGWCISWNTLWKLMVSGHPCSIGKLHMGSLTMGWLFNHSAVTAMANTDSTLFRKEIPTETPICSEMSNHFSAMGKCMDMCIWNQGTWTGRSTRTNW